MTKFLKTLLAVLAFAFASDAKATPRTGTFTIDIPQILVWVDPTGAVISGFDGYFEDQGGNLWVISDFAVAQPVAGALGAWLYYASSNCTGTPYICYHCNALPTVVVQVGGSYYVGTNPTSVSLISKWNGTTCLVEPPGTVLGYIPQQVYPPTLPAGPYHLEYR